MAGKVTLDLAESNGSLSHFSVFMTVTCGPADWRWRSSLAQALYPVWDSLPHT